MSQTRKQRNLQCFTIFICCNTKITRVLLTSSVYSSGSPLIQFPISRLRALMNRSARKLHHIGTVRLQQHQHGGNMNLRDETSAPFKAAAATEIIYTTLIKVVFLGKRGATWQRVKYLNLLTTWLITRHFQYIRRSITELKPTIPNKAEPHKPAPQNALKVTCNVFRIKFQVSETQPKLCEAGFIPEYNALGA